jgi:hypothetical protein
MMKALSFCLALGERMSKKEIRMKRTLLAAALGGVITVIVSSVSAQAAPVTVPKVAESSTSLVQTAGYGYEQRRHYRHRRLRHRPVVRWHHYREQRRHVRQHHRYVRPHYRHWTHRDQRRYYD